MNATELNVVLLCPEIPQNTGNIGRLCVNTDATLHLVKPFVFSLEDKYLKRAGLDYWAHLRLKIHESVPDFLQFSSQGEKYFFSTKGKKCYWDCPFKPRTFIIFGNESSGFPSHIYQDYSNNMYHIPMPGKNARSLNLANAVAVVVYEFLRINSFHAG